MTIGTEQRGGCAAVRAENNSQVLLRWMTVLAVLATTLVWSVAAQARSAPESFADLAEQLLPTVVNIATTQTIEEDNAQRLPQGGEELEEFFRDFFERRGGRPQEPRRGGAQGSGFIVDPDGYIVTNHHVVADADAVSVRLQDGSVLEAEIIGSDEKTDLALIKVEPKKPLPYTKWGDSDHARIGDWVIAIGNPFGLGGSVSAGIISARARDIRSGPYDDYIQTDAAINRGNSGGPLFNMDGKVIGINTAIFSPSGGSIGIGFAIPAVMAENVVKQLRENGEVRRGWLGVHIQTVTEELAEGLRLDHAKGALVASVTEGGPAEKAGIKQGDVILEFDGREVEEMRKLPRMVAETAIGKEVEVTLWRRGEEKTVEVVLGELNEDEIASAAPSGGQQEEYKTGKIDELGLYLGRLTNEARERFGLGDAVSGVVITDVDPNGNAAQKSLRPGDVIVEVDQEEVTDPADVAEQVTHAKDAGFRVVTLLIYRQGEYQWVAVKLG